MLNKIKQIIKIAKNHKIISITILLVVVFGGYFGYKFIFGKEQKTQYLTAEVERGFIVSSVSGTGQVSASDQVSIKSKTSGDVLYIKVNSGEEVKSGNLLVQIDTKDAQQAVNDAKTDLETAKLELDKLLDSPDELELLKAENNLLEAYESKEQAEENIIDGYEDAFNKITSVFLDLPDIMSSLEDILYSQEIAKSESTIDDIYDNLSVLRNSADSKLEPFIRQAEEYYDTARDNYDETFDHYSDLNRYSGYEEIEKLLEESIETTRSISELIKSEINMLNYWTDYRSQNKMPVYSQVSQYKTSLNSYTSSANSYLSNLLSEQRSLKDNEEAVSKAERSIEELEISLADLKDGADELEIRAKEINLQKKEDALASAKEELASCYVYAPFDGLVAQVNVKKGDSVSSGSEIATIITKQEIAEISLNEVDITKIKLDQKVNITFDAIEDLNVTGQIIEIDTLGTTSQGVVSYTVKIGFDIDDERVKNGMSVTTEIIVDSRQNVLTVPVSAVKTSSGSSFVQVLENGLPAQKEVETGLADDVSIEILSGLEEGDQIVIQSVSSSSTSSSTDKGPGGEMDVMRMMR